jgi:hypothetical protein
MEMEWMPIHIENFWRPIDPIASHKNKPCFAWGSEAMDRAGAFLRSRGSTTAAGRAVMIHVMTIAHLRRIDANRLRDYSVGPLRHGGMLLVLLSPNESR